MSAEIPVSTILFQTLNFSIVCGILYVLGKKRIAAILESKHQQVKTSMEEAKAQLNAALAQRKYWKDKIEDLENNSQKRLQQAEVDAQTRSDKIIEDAKNVLDVKEKDAAFTFERELKKVKNEIYQDVVEGLCASSRETLSSSDEVAKKPLNPACLDEIQNVSGVQA